MSTARDWREWNISVLQKVIEFPAMPDEPKGEAARKAAAGCAANVSLCLYLFSDAARKTCSNYARDRQEHQGIVQAAAEQVIRDFTKVLDSANEWLGHPQLN